MIYNLITFIYMITTYLSPPPLLDNDLLFYPGVRSYKRTSVNQQREVGRLLESAAKPSDTTHWRALHIHAKPRHINERLIIPQLSFHLEFLDVN